MSTKEIALELATKWHEGQERWGGEPYITHPIAVAGLCQVKFDNYIIVCYLHDVVEDTECTLEDLIRLGFSPEVVAAVEAMTHREDELYYKYILRLSINEIATIVKIADLTHNSLGAKDTAKRMEKYTLAKAFLQERAINRSLAEMLDNELQR